MMNADLIKRLRMWAEVLPAGNASQMLATEAADALKASESSAVQKHIATIQGSNDRRHMRFSDDFDAFDYALGTKVYIQPQVSAKPLTTDEIEQGLGGRPNNWDELVAVVRWVEVHHNIIREPTK